MPFERVGDGQISRMCSDRALWWDISADQFLVLARAGHHKDIVILPGTRFLLVLAQGIEGLGPFT